MLSEEALQRVLAEAGLSAQVRWDDVTASTNATAMEMAANGSPEWTLVAAAHQTEGRGRHGRRWVDVPGRALMFSVVIRPEWEAGRLGLVSLAAGAAMAEAVAAASGADVRCKWPNDLMVGESKVGGILGEAEILEDVVRHVVIGIGVNLDLPGDVAGAGAIGDVDEERLLADFLRRFRLLVEDHVAHIPQRWRAVSGTLGRVVEAATVGGDTVRGAAADLDERGGLIVVTDDGPVTVAFGEIHHLDVDRG